MQLPYRENRGKNSKAIYNRPSWSCPNRTRKRDSPHDEVRNGIGVDDELGTSSQSVKPSSAPARKKNKSARSNVTKRRGGSGKLKSSRRTKNRSQNSRVKDMSCSRVDVDVTSTALASQHGKCRVVFNFRPKH